MMIKIRCQNAFTIVELLVAMSLLVIMLGLSGMVFNTTVDAHRAAGASIEVTRNLRAVTDQLSADFRGLRKDGEILLIWIAKPAIDKNGSIIDENGDSIPDSYQKFDRIIFFADGDFQSMRQFPYDSNGDGTIDGNKTVIGNLARISYIHAKQVNGTKAPNQADRAGRILARTEHIVTADASLPLFPDPANLLPANWNSTNFDQSNFYDYEYQTITMGEWTNMSDQSSPYVAAKNDILTILSGVLNILATTTVSGGGPTIEIGQTNTYHNFFCSGVGEFGIQIWLEDQQRWFPQIDPNGDGDYSDTDYPLAGSVIHQKQVDGFLYNGTEESSLMTAYGNVPLKFTALKFTFTLYDSKGIFADGKTFTHIVTIN